MSRRKKITIAVLIIAVIVFGLLLFLEFGEPTTGPSQQPDQEEPIFPFATTSDFFTGEDDDGTDIDDQPTEPSEQPDLWRISDDPVAGSAWVRTGSNQEQIWFIKQANGFLFAANPESREVTQLTDTRIPQVREAIIGPSGQTAIYRYLDDQETIQTYQATVTPTSEESEVPYTVSGSFLPTDIYEITLSPDGSQLFYLQEVNNQSVGVLYNITSGTQQQIFSSQVSNWRISFNQANTVTLFTPPADDVTGYAYSLNLSTGEKEKLTEGAALALKSNQNGSHHIMTTQTNDRFQISPLSATSTNTTINTFIDKCSWANEDVFFCGVPENTTLTSINSWYQGRQQFTDNLHVFNVNEDTQDQLFNPEQIEKANADITDISINESFRYSIFTDRTTGDLWGYEL